MEKKDKHKNGDDVTYFPSERYRSDFKRYERCALPVIDTGENIFEMNAYRSTATCGRNIGKR